MKNQTKKGVPAHSFSELLHIVTEAQSPLTLNKTMKVIMNSLCDVLEAQASSILLTEKKESGQLYFHIATGQKAHRLASFTVSVEKGIAGWVARTRKPLLVKEATSDPRFYRELAEQIGFIPGSILCIPLVARGKLLGVLEILREKGKEPFSESELDFLTQVSSSLALSLSHSLLFETLQERAKKLEARKNLRELFVGESSFSEQARELLLREKNSPPPLLLIGQAGTGKTHLAYLLHQLRDTFSPFHRLVLAHKKTKPHWAPIWSTVGKGTVLIENLEQLSPLSQAALAQHLEEGFPHPVTGKIEPVSAKVIFTTRAPLTSFSSFPPFLFDLLVSTAFTLPPLKERREDILPLAFHFLNKLNKVTGQTKSFSSSFKHFLFHSDFPENITTLKNLIEETYGQSSGENLYFENIPLPLRKKMRAHLVFPFRVLLEDYRTQLKEVSSSLWEEAKLAGLELKEWQELLARYGAPQKEKK